MVKFTIHRKENGEPIKLVTAVLYIRENGEWRLATKSEGDVFAIHAEMSSPMKEYPFPVSIDWPLDEVGEDGDFYGVIYPVEWSGRVWRET